MPRTKNTALRFGPPESQRVNPSQSSPPTTQPTIKIPSVKSVPMFRDESSLKNKTTKVKITSLPKPSSSSSSKIPKPVVMSITPENIGEVSKSLCRSDQVVGNTRIPKTATRRAWLIHPDGRIESLPLTRKPSPKQMQDWVGGSIERSVPIGKGAPSKYLEGSERCYEMIVNQEGVSIGMPSNKIARRILAEWQNCNQNELAPVCGVAIVTDGWKL